MPPCSSRAMVPHATSLCSSSSSSSSASRNSTNTASAGSESGSGSGSGSIPTTVPLSLAHHESLEWAPSSNQTSRYLRHLTEYKRIRTLGRGAFGTTHLVKNVIDSRQYALKCIRLSSQSDTIISTKHEHEHEQQKEDNNNEMGWKTVLREVDALSALRSENVVRYYAAWVERGELGVDDDNDNDDSLIRNNNGVNDDDDDDYNEYDMTDWTEDAASSSVTKSSALQCTCNLCHQTYVDWEISYEQWGLIDSVLQPLNLCTECYIKSLPGDSIDASTIDIRQKCKLLPHCLYILMEYAGNTLNEEMNYLNDDDDAEIADDHGHDAADKRRWSLFAQCVQGLYSIHEEGYVHRDIKPTNILVQDGVVKIADLGLASYQIKSSIIASSSSSSSSDSTNNAHHGSSEGTESAGIGTLLYSAPEVDESRYGKSNDIYSMGIVLIELFSHFATGMERVAVLSKIREGKFPSSDDDDWGNHPRSSSSTTGTDQAMELARSMVDLDPGRRPSARRILEILVRKGLIADPDSGVLAEIIARLQDRVGTLERKVLERERESEGLRRLLRENGIHVPQSFSVQGV